MNIKLSHADRGEIVATLQSGNVTATALAVKYGVSQSAISVLFKKMTGKGLGARYKLTQTDRETIVAEIQSGKTTMTELAERYKVSVSSIGDVFEKMTGHGLKRQLSQSEIQAIVAELQAGNATIKEVAAKYGVGRSTITYNFKKITGTSLHPRKLNQTDRTAIVTALKAGTEPNELAPKYGVSNSYIGSVYKQETGTLRKLPQLSQGDKETIVAAVQSGKASQRNLAVEFNINRSRVSSVIKEASALQESQYRAWHKKLKKMYPVFGIDWFNRKILVPSDVTIRWYRMDHFIMMEYSGLRDSKRTKEYPEGQKIYTGDIVQFPVKFTGNKGKTTWIETWRDVVGFGNGQFILSEITEFDPLCLWNDECEIIGTVYENPEMMNKVSGKYDGFFQEVSV